MTVTGRNGTYPAVGGSTPLKAIVVLGNQTDAIGGLCGESAYGVRDCAFNGPGNTLRCVR